MLKNKKLDVILGHKNKLTYEDKLNILQIKNVLNIVYYIFY